MQSVVLTKEQKILLFLTAKSIAKDPLSLVLDERDLEGVDWKVVVDMATKQAVPLATFDAVAPYVKTIPQEIFIKWQKIAMSVLHSGFFVVQSQAELVKILTEKFYPYIILKGLAANAYYPNKGIRALGDVDFLINPAQQAEIEGVLIEKGYEKSHGDHPNHVVFKKSRAHLEMHFEVAGVPYGAKGDLVREFLKSAVFEPKACTQDGFDFFVPTPENHALILLLHMQHHMLGEGLGLRHLCDWATFVNATYDEPFWQEKVIPFLKKIGLYRYASVMTKTCTNYLKSACPDWAKEVDDDVCAEVVEDVLACGNFGQNDPERSKGGMLVSEHGKDGTKHGRLYHLFKILHDETIGTKLVKACVIFYPFAYIYKIFWHLWRTVTGKSKPLKVYSEAEKRKKVYDKLKVFDGDC